MVKTGKEAETVAISLPDSGNSLHKKVSKSFPIFAKCTKKRRISLKMYLGGDE